MIWSQREIRQAIEGTVSGAIDTVTLRLYDMSTPAGIGLTPGGSIVLIAKGEPNGEPISGKYFSYEPWRTVYPDNAEPLNEVSLLVVSYPDVTSGELDALSVLLTGLVSMHSTSRFGSSQGQTIAALVELLESRLSSGADRSIQIGLAGELLVMLNSSNPDQMVEFWRNRTEAAYDFSSAEECLEIKTTSNEPREHSFSSRQLPPRSGIALVIISILLTEVESGTSIASMFEKLHLRLTTSINRTKLLRCCIETLGTHPQFVNDLQIDLETSRRSMLMFVPEQIPTPLLVAGVSQMNWTANIPPTPSSTASGPLSSLLQKF